MTQEETQATTETVSESPATETTQDSSSEQYIAESKKYRKRAQDAETRNIEYEKKLASIETETLKNKEDKAEYISKLESDVSQYKEKADLHDSYVEVRKNELLETHSEEDREDLSKLDLKTLELVTKKINNVKANAPEIAGNPRQPVKSNTNWAKMDVDERRNNWGEIVKSYNKGNE